MPRKLTFQIVPSMLVALAVLQQAPRAMACSRACSAPVQLPRGAELPGNMLYFKLLSDSPGELLLRTAAGEPIAAGVRTIANDRVFAPEAPVPAGTELVLEYTSDCGVASEFELIAAPHGELELRPAALVIDEQGLQNPGQLGEISFLRLRYYSPDVNGLAASLMSHRFTLDGHPVDTVTIDGTELIQVATACRPLLDEPLIDTCGFLRQVMPGLHTVVATTTIVGQATQPEPVTLEVEVSCGEGSVVDEAPAEPSLPAIDTRVTSDGTPPPLPAPPASSSEPRASEASGCSLTAAPASSAVGGGAWIAALALLATRLRRRAA